MNIDTQTFAIVMSAATAIFAGLYFRLRMMNHFKEMQHHIDNHRDVTWRNLDRIEERIDAVDRRTADCCKTEGKQSYYNSGT